MLLVGGRPIATEELRYGLLRGIADCGATSIWIFGLDLHPICIKILK